MNVKYVMTLVLVFCVISTGFSESSTEQSKPDVIPPADFSTLMEKGIEAHDHGDYERALSYYHQALQLEKNEWVWYEIGYTKLKMNNYDEALDAFKQSIAINRLYSNSYWQMGIILSQRKDYKAGNMCYLLAFVSDPSNMHSLNNIAINLGIEDKRKALDFFKLLLRRFPTDKFILYNLAQLYEENEIIYSQAEDFDIGSKFSDTMTSFDKMGNLTSDIKEFETAYFKALTCLAYHDMENAKTYLHQCMNGGNETYKGYCNTIISNKYTVKGDLTDEKLLKGIKRLLNIDENPL